MSAHDDRKRNATQEWLEASGYDAAARTIELGCRGYTEIGTNPDDETLEGILAEVCQNDQPTMVLFNVPFPDPTLDAILYVPGTEQRSRK